VVSQRYRVPNGLPEASAAGAGTGTSPDAPASSVKHCLRDVHGLQAEPVDCVSRAACRRARASFWRAIREYLPASSSWRRWLLTLLSAPSLLVIGPQSKAHGRECAYVVNFESDSVAEIDLATERLRRTFHLNAIEGCRVEQPPQGVKPWHIALTPDGSRAYVTTGLCLVHVIDPIRGVLDLISVGRFEGRYPITAGPDGQRVYVGYENSQFAPLVSIIDTQSDEVRETIPVPSLPNDIEISRNEDRAYVAGTRIAVIDIAAGEVIQELGGEQQFTELAVGPEGLALYTGSRPLFPNEEPPPGIYMYETQDNMLAKYVPLPGPPASIVLAPDGGIFYATTGGGVDVIDSSTLGVLSVIPVEKGIVRLAVTADGKYAYGTAAIGDFIVRIDTTRLIVDKTIPLTDCGKIHGQGRVPNDPYAACLPSDIAIAPCFCPSDCNRNGSVEINEVVQSVNIGLGLKTLPGCRVADPNGDGLVSVDEIVAAVNAALGDCG